MTTKQYNPRRTFSVKGQLLGKLGQHGFSQLLHDLEAGMSPAQLGGPAPTKTRRRRGGRGRTQAAA